MKRQSSLREKRFASHRREALAVPVGRQNDAKQMGQVGNTAKASDAGAQTQCKRRSLAKLASRDETPSDVTGHVRRIAMPAERRCRRIDTNPKQTARLNDVRRNKHSVQHLIEQHRRAFVNRGQVVRNRQLAKTCVIEDSPSSPEPPSKLRAATSTPSIERSTSGRCRSTNRCRCEAWSRPGPSVLNVDATNDGRSTPASTSRKPDVEVGHESVQRDDVAVVGVEQVGAIAAIELVFTETAFELIIAETPNI